MSTERDADLRPSQRALELAPSLASAYLQRMGETSWPQYARSAMITGALQRRRGVSGLALRRAAYPLLFASARRPVIAEDVVIRGPRRIHLGEGVLLEQRVILDAKSRRGDGIQLGDRVMMRAATLVDTGYDGYVHVGARTEIGTGCELRGLGGITIGERCLFAHNVIVISSEHVLDDPDMAITDQGNRLAPVTIGDGVWLGANVVVLGGVAIGRGAVIGANSVVRADIPPGAIAAGAPARVLRQRPGWSGPMVVTS